MGCCRKPTALEVVKNVDLRGKTILITGSTSGIGIETARALALKGAHLVLCNRNMQLSEQQRTNLYRESGRKGGIDIIQMDLASLHSIRAAAKQFIAKNWPLHVLVLNAGVLYPGKKETVDGYRTEFGVNHLGHFYLLRLLMHKLRQSAPSRLVIVSSEGHKYTGISANLPTEQKLAKLVPSAAGDTHTSAMYLYDRSKLCNVLTAMKIHSDENANGINTYVLHPGIIKTEIFRDSGSAVKLLIGVVLKPFRKNLEEGAATTVYCAASPDCANESGHYYDNCKAADGSMAKALAHDKNLQDALWNKSIELIEKFEKKNPA